MKLINEKMPTPSASSCQNAIRSPSGLQRKPSRRWNSSSYTQSKVPLMIVAEPSVVSWSIQPVSRFST